MIKRTTRVTRNLRSDDGQDIYRPERNPINRFFMPNHVAAIAALRDAQSELGDDLIRNELSVSAVQQSMINHVYFNSGRAISAAMGFGLCVAGAFEFVRGVTTMDDQAAKNAALWFTGGMMLIAPGALANTDNKPGFLTNEQLTGAKRPTSKQSRGLPGLSSTF